MVVMIFIATGSSRFAGMIALGKGWPVVGSNGRWAAGAAEKFPARSAAVGVSAVFWKRRCERAAPDRSRRRTSCS